MGDHNLNCLRCCLLLRNTEKNTVGYRKNTFWCYLKSTMGILFLGVHLIAICDGLKITALYLGSDDTGWAMTGNQDLTALFTDLLESYLTGRILWEIQ